MIARVVNTCLLVRHGARASSGYIPSTDKYRFITGIADFITISTAVAWLVAIFVPVAIAITWLFISLLVGG